MGLGICLPLGLREAALLVPALPLALHAKLIAQAYDAKHTVHPSIQLLPPLRPPSRPRPHCRCHRWVVAVIITITHHPDLSVSGYCSHPTRSFPPVAIHQPPIHQRPPTSAHPPAALRPLCTSSLGRQTNRQTDGHTVRQTPSRKFRKPGSSRSSKSATLSDSVTRPLASCNILCNTIPQLAHAILCYTRS